MIDFRLYRAGFAPVLAAIVVLLFALTAPPDPLPEVVAPAEFDEDAATKTAEQITELAPARSPGSEGDAAAGDLVQRRFESVEGGLVSDQPFAADFDGDDVDLRNVIVTLPGESSRAIVVMAPRDSARGPGAASSAAATATLLELLDAMRTQSHSRTLVFVSTDGSAAGAAGAREFARSYPERDKVDAVIDLWQPGYATPRQPFVLDSSDGSQSPSGQLVRTAEREVSAQTGERLEGQGTLGELAALAIPSGLSEGAVLISSGMDAVGLSAAGERPLSESEGQPDDLSSTTVGEFGRAALLLTAALDSASAPLEHGPETSVPLAGNLVPGWALALLALTLLLPAALAAADGLRRAVRREPPATTPASFGAKAPHLNTRMGWAVAWAVSRSLPLLAGLLFFYLLALVGLVARPPFPFDPNLFGVGAGQVLVMVLGALAIGGTYYAIRGWKVPAALPSAAAVPALGVTSTLVVFVTWLANPFLALLLVPTAHVWLTCATRRGPAPWPFVAGAAAAALVPLAAALGHTASALAFGAEAPWLLLLMVSDGQIGFWTMIASSVIIGCLLGAVAVSLRGPVGSPADSLDASPITRPAFPDDLNGEGQ